MAKINIGINGSVFEHIGWKSYNSIVKKAMEQEFSWSGLSISLAIAFFIVIASAQTLSLAYKSLASAPNKNDSLKTRIYQLESATYQSSGIRVFSIEKPLILDNNPTIWPQIA